MLKNRFGLEMSKLAAFVAVLSFVFIQFAHAAVLDAEHLHHEGTTGVFLSHYNYDNHHEDDYAEANEEEFSDLHQSLHDHLTFSLQVVSLLKDPIFFDDVFNGLGHKSGPGLEPAPPVPPPYH